MAAVAVMARAVSTASKGYAAKLLERYGPPQAVGPTRYRIGLVMLAGPVLFGWLTPYVADILPDLGTHRLIFALGGDLVLLTSLVVLGGEFWDKLYALFVHGARVVPPPAEPGTNANGAGAEHLPPA